MSVKDRKLYNEIPTEKRKLSKKGIEALNDNSTVEPGGKIKE